MRPHIELYTITELYHMDKNYKDIAIGKVLKTNSYEYFATDIVDLELEESKDYCFRQSGGHFSGELYTDYNYGGFYSLEYENKFDMLKKVRDKYFPHLGDHLLHYINDNDLIDYGTVSHKNTGVFPDVYYNDGHNPYDMWTEAMSYSEEVIEVFIKKVSREYDKEHARVCDMFLEEYEYLTEDAYSYENVECFIEDNDILFSHECIPYKKKDDDKYYLMR